MNESTETSDAAESDALRQLGASADMGSDASVNEPAEHAAGDGDATTETSTTAPKADDESSPTPEKPAEEQKAEDPPKEPSKYEKAKQREAAAWNKINAEKEAIQREREEIVRLRQALPAERPPAAPKPVTDEKGNTAQDYEDAAKAFAAEGDNDLATKARAKAQEMRQREQVPAPTEAPAAQQRFESDWKADMEATIKANADLAKPDSEQAKGLQGLLREHPYLGQIPGGFSKAVQLLQLQAEAGKVKGLMEENSRHKAELDRLNKLTGIRGGGPSAPAKQKSFEDLSDAEQEAELRSLGDKSLFA